MLDGSRVSKDYQPSWRIENYALTDPTAQSNAPVLVSTDPDTQPQWRKGERFHHLFEARCERFGREANKRIAVEYPNDSYTYAALDAMANQISRFLADRGIVPDDRIGLLMDRSIYSHASVLAISKLGASYVPLDASFPSDRIDFILKDSGARTVLTLSEFAFIFTELGIDALALDTHKQEINKLSSRAQKSRKPQAENTDEDALCYIIYTSGSTGRPKGVAVRHSSICNFLQVAVRTYGYKVCDRVYQGMTIAFDFSIEELWVPLIVGATLVPAPSGVNLLGDDLVTFLKDRHISAMCCVPTLLATMDDDLPKLTFLMVSGEASSKDLIDPWYTPGRRILNTYGPTETTVTATWTILQPDNKVTIGGPLPTYSVLIIAPDSLEVPGQGEIGEICIAGIGLAEGYINSPTQTDKAFIHDFIGIDDNPSGKIYRTGDLGRINDDKEIECLGRIDTQVKIRGYRIELDEIESVIRRLPGVGQVIVNPYEFDHGPTELVSYIKPQNNAKFEPARIHDALRERLPAYMVPTFYEKIDEIPLLPSTKADRQRLPQPSGARLTASGNTYVAPRPGRESELAELMARLLNVERVSVDAHFFNELGANSLQMAQFATGTRRQLGITRVSIKILYQNPSIRALDQALGEAKVKIASGPASSDLSLDVVQSARAPSTNIQEQLPTQQRSLQRDHDPARPADIRRPTASTGKEQSTRPMDRHTALKAPLRIASNLDYYGCGLLQFAYYVVQLFLASYFAVLGYHWIATADTLVGVYWRAAECGVLFFFGASAWLIAIKWMAVGRFNTDPIPIWSLRYLRFWIAKSAIQSNPLNLLAGTPLYSHYLRLLGARIGQRTVIFARPPVCTDLITVGDDTVIRQDCFFQGYKAHSGYLYPGTITIGDRAFVGEATVLDTHSSIADDAQLGTSSALLESQCVPSGKIYQGSPAEPCDTAFNRVPPRKVNTASRTVYVVSQILTIATLTFPITFVLIFLVSSVGLSTFTDDVGAVRGTIAFGDLLNFSALLYFGAIAFGLVVIVSVPRFLNQFFVPATTHALYGMQFALARTITRLTNSRNLNTLFGDSSMIVYFLSAVGYDLSESTQTGSNFGVDQRHHSPYLCKFNRNTLVSDGLMMLNMEASSTSFRLSPIHVPADSYLGNMIHYPPEARVGENCLIATKAMVPVDGPLLEGVGILGSPPFEIPRSVMRDRKFDHYKQSGVLEQRLKLKLRSNLVTLGMYMFRNWSATFLIMLIAAVTYQLFRPINADAVWLDAGLITGLSVVSTLLIILYAIFFEHLAVLFRPLKPLYCSLYDSDFWLHERFWKMNYNFFLTLFNGTPMKNLFLRLQGARVGSKVFDDGAALTEPALVSVGDNCCLNFGSSIQCHSLEDGTFKSDYIEIESGCSIGVRGFVHYGTTMRANATLSADAFLMKGTTVEQDTTWSGNPAMEVPGESNIADVVELHNTPTDIRTT